jgi:hypothetical protein
VDWINKWLLFVVVQQTEADDYKPGNSSNKAGVVC